MIDIVSVGNQKVEYRNHNEIQFESLSFYLELAQKAIAKFGKNFSPTLSKEMLKSEDAIANVANCIMMADWRWDKDRKGETGQQKTKYSYRNQCAIWAIKSYMSRKKQKKSKRGIDTQYGFDGDNEFSLLDILTKDTNCAIDQIIEQEESLNIRNHIEQILSPKNNILSERQCEYLKMYYFDDMTFAEIGKKFNITREAVRQGIKKAIEKIQTISSH